MEAMTRTPKDTPIAAPVLIPSLDSEDALLVLLGSEPTVEKVLLKEGSKDVEEVSVDDSENIERLAVIVSVIIFVALAVAVCVFLKVSVAITVTMLCELGLISLERLSNPHS